MNKIIQFGENVEGYDVPVLSEREVRASAGILFLLLIISIFPINYEGDFFIVTLNSALSICSGVRRMEGDNVGRDGVS